MLQHYIESATTLSDKSKNILINKTLGRVQEPRANGAWLSKLTE